MMVVESRHPGAPPLLRPDHRIGDHRRRRGRRTRGKRPSCIRAVHDAPAISQGSERNRARCGEGPLRSGAEPDFEEMRLRLSGGLHALGEDLPPHTGVSQDHHPDQAGGRPDPAGREDLDVDFWRYVSRSHHPGAEWKASARQVRESAGREHGRHSRDHPSPRWSFARDFRRAAPLILH